MIARDSEAIRFFLNRRVACVPRDDVGVIMPSRAQLRDLWRLQTGRISPLILFGRDDKTGYVITCFMRVIYFAALVPRDDGLVILQTPA